MSHCYAKYFLVLCLAVLFCVGQLRSQDPQFSQFFATRIYLNPAFTGNTHAGRISMQFRKQWPMLDGYTTYGMYYDHNLWKINSGIGMSFIQDHQSEGALVYKKASGMYAYGFSLSRKLFARAGLSASYNAFDIDLSRFTFTDQLLSGSNVTVDDYRFARIQYIDFCSGVLLYTPSYWVGASLNNLNSGALNPNNQSNPFPLRWSLHSGVLVPVNKNAKGDFHQSVTIAAHYKAQLKYDQLDMGAYYGFSTLLLGVWYRGIPLFKNNESTQPNRDAFIIVLGMKHEGLRVSYSYDITVSALSRYSGGAHEATFQMELWRNRKHARKKNSRIHVQCPEFGPGWQK